MRSIYSFLFYDNYNYHLFILFGGLLFISIMISKSEIELRRKYVIFVISSFFAFGMLFRYAEYRDENPRYQLGLASEETGCLVEIYREKTEEVLFINTARFVHYFEGKTLKVEERTGKAEEIVEHIQEYVPTLKIEKTNEYNTSDISSAIDEVVAGTHNLQKDERLYILDKSWVDSPTILYTVVNGKEYFMSEQLVNDIVSGDYQKDLLEGQLKRLSAVQYMCLVRGERELNQVIFLLLVFVLGFLVANTFYKSDKIWLVVALAFPIGIAYICTLGIIAILLGFSFVNNSLVIMLLISFVTFIYIWVRNKIKVEKKQIIQIALVVCAVTFIVVHMKLFYFCGDSLYKTLYGMQLALFPMTRKEVLSFVPYGMMEPIIHALGWKYHIDFVYGLYVLSPISMVAILGTALYYFSDKQLISKLIITLSILILATNFEFNLYGRMVMSNSMMACDTLILVILLMSLEREKVLHVELLVALLSMNIVTTRVEGACYICLIFALASGMKWYRKSFKRINIVVGVVIFLWQGALVIFSDPDSRFWSKEKSIPLFLGASVIMVLPFVLNGSSKLIELINKYYYKLTLVALASMTVGLWKIGVELANVNAAVFLRQFATAIWSNAGALWGFFFLTIPLLCTEKKKSTAFLLTLVFDYIFLTYMIFSFREGVPIHEGRGDSCRRLLHQIMPIAMFTVAYVLNAIWEKQSNEKCINDKVNIIK